MSQQPQAATSHFDAAKVIVETLQGLDKTSQALAMRFAGETLGLQPAPVTHTPGPTLTPPTSSAPPLGLGGPTHSTDIKQFTAAKEPKTDQQFAAVVAYFYRFEAPEAQRRDTIDAGTFLEAARLTGRKRPGNPRATLLHAKNSGYLDIAATGQYRINSVGENLVAMTLPGNGSESAPARIANKKKTRKKQTGTKKNATGTAKNRQPRG